MSKALGLSRGSWQISTLINYGTDIAGGVTLLTSSVFLSPIASAIASVPIQALKPLKDTLIVIGGGMILENTIGSSKGFNLPLMDSANDYRNFFLGNIIGDLVILPADLIPGIAFITEIGDIARVPLVGFASVGVGKLIN